MKQLTEIQLITNTNFKFYLIPKNKEDKKVLWKKYRETLNQ